MSDGVQANAGHEEQLALHLRRLTEPCLLRISSGQLVAQLAVGHSHDPSDAVLSPACPASSLGSAEFRNAHGVRYAYHAGAMANGIASVDMVIALGQAGILASFGAAGLLLPEVERAIARIQSALPNGPYAFNLIHSPSEERLEQGSVDLYLRTGVRTVEASAYLTLTPHIVRYRLSGLQRGPDGRVQCQNRVIAKVSRPEVAIRFMEPAPEALVRRLLAERHISEEQAALAAHVPVADDITVEADSGGHTDNRPFITIVPALLRLRDHVQEARGYREPLRVGVGGGIGTPEAAMAAFTLGADYIVTGSVNQSCRQSGSSDRVRKLLAAAELTDFAMAPAADMFEMGVKLQVLKRGTLFPMRAGKLYELYRTYAAIDEIPQDERTKLEQQVFRAPLEQIWAQCRAFFSERDPAQIARAQSNPKRQMALIFRWYLGMSSRWANTGQPDREVDYQIWAGPSLGAFNDWVSSTYLADYRARDVRDVAVHLMTGAAYLTRTRSLRERGVTLPAQLTRYIPRAPLF